MKTIISLYPNLSRAVEIALAGKYSISIYYNAEDYPTGQADIDLVLSTVPDTIGISRYNPGDILIEVMKPSHFDYSRLESIDDILRRVDRVNQIPEFHANESILLIEKSAVDRANMGLNDVILMRKMSQTIAALDGSKMIQAHHFAEAVNYRLYQSVKTLTMYQ